MRWFRKKLDAQLQQVILRIRKFMFDVIFYTSQILYSIIHLYTTGFNPIVLVNFENYFLYCILSFIHRYSLLLVKSGIGNI